MNRRAFITRLASATVGVAAALHVPASVLTPTPAAARFIRDGAMARLLVAHRAFQREHGYPPSTITVGGQFYAAYDAELLPHERFVPAGFYENRMLMFKGAAVMQAGPGWAIKTLR